MTDFRLSARDIAAYARHLRREEKSPATVEKYLRDVCASVCRYSDLMVSLLAG